MVIEALPSPSFLSEALKYISQRVHTQTRATKITFDTRKRAWGVEFEIAGNPCFLSAKREIILSAGAFQSLQLVMFVFLLHYL